jgi:hypothetical protein
MLLNKLVLTRDVVDMAWCLTRIVKQDRRVGGLRDSRDEKVLLDERRIWR